MKDFHHTHTRRSAEKEKKGRKIKNHLHSGDNCSCFSPAKKVHHHNCPVVLKPCPIHGNEFYREEKEQNVVISFHPSSKTEKLFQPIKSLLAQCNSGTKINLQYYSPRNSMSKDSVTASYSQNTYNLKKSLNNTFIEKTKSFVAEKTSRVKKLKQCFYSPCNSITQKSRSQTSIKERLNQILRDETKQTRNVFYNLVPEMPPDDKNWFYSNLGGFKNRDKLSEEKMASDFITVTQHDKNNVINHKIFEIKHNKGGNDVPFVGFPQQTQFVYSSVNAGGPPVIQNRQTPTKKGRDDAGNRKAPYISSSEKTHRSISSSSSGSVYITPFFFLPKEIKNYDVDSRKGKTQNEELIKSEKAVQANDVYIKKATSTTKATQTTPRTSTVQSKATEYSNEPKSKSILLQTECLCKSSKSSSAQSSEPLRTSYPSKTTVEEIYVNNERVYNKKHSKVMSERTGSTQSRSTGVQAGTSFLYKEVMISAQWGGNTKDKISQTDDKWNLKVSVKAMESKAAKPKMPADKEIQTEFSQEGSDNSEYMELNCPNVTYVIKPFDELSSEQEIDKNEKTCWGKAHSDSDLFDRMACDCWKSNNEDPVPQEDRTRNFREKKSPVTTKKIFECVATETENETSPNTKNVVLRTTETVERVAVTKETSTRDDGVSDLSELKRIIQELFERSSIPPKKSCECDEKKSTTSKKIEPEVKVLKSAEEPREKHTKDSEAQTDFRVLLNEAGQERTGRLTVKLRNTVLVNESQPKTFYICDVCGRDIVKYSADVGTNTEAPKKENDVKKISKRDEDMKKLVFETYEIEMQTKKVKGDKSTNNDKPWTTYDPRTASQSGSVHKPTTQVSSCTPHLRPKNNETRERICQRQTHEERKPKVFCQHQKTPIPTLLEESAPGPSCGSKCEPPATCCYIAQMPQTCSKPVEGKPKTKPDPKRDQCPGKIQNKKTNSDFNYCVLVAQPWPKDLVPVPWDSTEKSDTNALVDVPQSRALNQKRSSQRDVTLNTGGKTIKEKVQEPPRWSPVFENAVFSKVINAGKNDQFRLWLGGKPLFQQEDIYEFNDELPPTRENSPENLEELSEELVELSDVEDDTALGNSGFEDEQPTAEEEDTEPEPEIDERLLHILRESSTIFQTHPSMTLNRSFHSTEPSTTKSLNRLYSIRQPKKKRRTLV